MELVVELCVSDETVCRALVSLVHEESDRVLSCHCVHRTVRRIPCIVSVDSLLVIYREGRVHTVSCTDGTLVRPVVCREHTLTVEVDCKVVVEEYRREVYRNGTSVHMVCLEDTVLCKETT